MKKHFLIAGFCSLIIALGACQSSGEAEITNTLRFEDGSSLFNGPTDSTLIVGNAFNEASGLAASRRNPGLLWTHNDSGDTTRLYLFDIETGQTSATFILNGNTTQHVDWEDIAVASIDNDVKVLVADIGDNNSERSSLQVYVFTEPRLVPGGNTQNVPLESVQTVTLQYEDGPRNAEALMVDEATNTWYILTKSTRTARLYSIANPSLNSTTTQTLRFETTLPAGLVTAATANANATEVLVRTYNNVFYWQRSSNESFASLIDQTGFNLPYQEEEQGEAICWDTNGQTYYTISEAESGNTAVYLYHYSRQ